VPGLRLPVLIVLPRSGIAEWDHSRRSGQWHSLGEPALLHVRSFDATTALIEDAYDAKRMHSALGYRPPAEFESVRRLERQADDPRHALLH